MLNIAQREAVRQSVPAELRAAVDRLLDLWEFVDAGLRERGWSASDLRRIAGEYAVTRHHALATMLTRFSKAVEKAERSKL